MGEWSLPRARAFLLAIGASLTLPSLASASVGDAVATLAEAAQGTASFSDATDALGGFIRPTLLDASPRDGEADVAVTRETILRFSAPLDPATVNASAISARSAGGALSPTIHLSPAGDTVTLFYPAPLAASTRVAVTVDG
ncbi:MAG: Ig-like domain-containing protein, partial [Myxococcales bacterium]|nr:Ig-like domain-containing protein [Myxococcales bacterium]